MIEGGERRRAMAPPTPNGDLDTDSQYELKLTTKIKRSLANLLTWEIWKAILFGQLVSLLNCATGVISQSLTEFYKVNAPTAQSFLNYFLLGVVYTTWLACRPGDKGLISVVRSRGWVYLFLAAFDVEGNYLLVKAYQYTTLTSVQLLDCFTIPGVLVLSWLFLKTRYQIPHIIGVGICLLGVGCVVWADVDNGETINGGSDPLLGDMLVLAGACCYAATNVGEEFYVKRFDKIEFLGMIGLFGSVISGIQLSLLERDEVASIDWGNWQIDVLLVAFAFILFSFYTIVPEIMKMTSATAFNLSMLSCDFYSLIVGIFLFGYSFEPLYFLSFSLVIIGIILYSLRKTTSGAEDSRQLENNRESTMETIDNVEMFPGAPKSPADSLSSSFRSYPSQVTSHLPETDYPVFMR